MSRSILCLANTAGGSGKSTLAHALSVAFTEYGKKTLLIDLDPRAHLSFRVGRENSRLSISDFLQSTVTVEDLDTHIERFDFIASDSRCGFGFSDTDLKNLIDTLPKEFDVIVIDTPSDVNPGLLAALKVSDLVLIPYSQTLHHYRGIDQICKLAPKTNRVLLQIGKPNKIADQFSQWAHLDGRCSTAREISEAELTVTSVLTTAKNSVIAGEIRESAYSVLEELGIA
jgi:cellulose biosynthesis protein BcsQ